MQVYSRALFLFLLLDIPGHVPVENTTKPAKYGDPITLDCIENEKPVTYIFWEYQNKTDERIYDIFWRNENDTGNKWGLIYSDEDFKNGNFSITIRSTTFKYEGQYSCFTQIKEMDSKTNSKITVKVIGWYQSVAYPSKGTLCIPLHSNVSVKLYFWRNGTGNDIGKIEINAEGKGQPALKERYSNRSEVENEVLRIHGVTSDDAGVYTVQDEYGNNISTVRVEITSPGVSNSTSKNSADGPGTYTILWIFGVLVILCLVLCVFIYKRNIISRPGNECRFSVCYQRAAQEDN